MSVAGPTRALVPLFGVTAFGRGYVDLELCFALFCVAGWIAWTAIPMVATS